MDYATLLRDIEAPGALHAAATAVTAAASRELVLLATASDRGSLRMCNATLHQMRALGIAGRALVVTDTPAACGQLARGPVCAWSSRVVERAPADSESARRYWDGRFRFYAAKKRYLADLVRSGFSVLQADSDMLWRRDPWPLLRRAPRNCSIVVQQDRPFANAGLIFARPGSRGAQWVLDELAWRIDVFQRRPEAVAAVAPFARPPYYANSDDQTGLNDVLVSAVLGGRTFLGAQARYEAHSRHHPTSRVQWETRAEARTFAAQLEAVRARARTLRWGAHAVVALPIVGSGGDHACVAPRHVFAHLPERAGDVMTHLARARGADKVRELQRRGLWPSD